MRYVHKVGGRLLVWPPSKVVPQARLARPGVLSSDAWAGFVFYNLSRLEHFQKRARSHPSLTATART